VPVDPTSTKNAETRSDIRSLLKTFGIQADEILTAYIEENPDGPSLEITITLEATVTSGTGIEKPLSLVMEGTVSR
jgi:hypothetical protein